MTGHAVAGYGDVQKTHHLRRLSAENLIQSKNPQGDEAFDCAEASRNLSPRCSCAAALYLCLHRRNLAIFFAGFGTFKSVHFKQVVSLKQHYLPNSIARTRSQYMIIV